METQQSLAGVSAPIRDQGSIRSLSNSVETPDVTSAGKILALLRLLFAFSLVVLATGAVRPSGAESQFISAVLWGYVFYSAALCTGLLARLELAKSVNHYSAWIDLGCFAFLVMLTRGANPVLFGGFWLSILSAYLAHDRYVGLVVTVVVAMILAIDLLFNFGSLSFSMGVQPELAEAIALICSLLILGILAFYLKGQKATLESRVALLLDLSDFSNPRFGAEWSLNTLMEKVRAFYQADGCLLIDFLEGDSSYRIHRQTSQGCCPPYRSDKSGMRPPVTCGSRDTRICFEPIWNTHSKKPICCL